VKAMRGLDGMQEALFTVAKLEDSVPADHRLRPIRTLVNEALGRLNGLFNLIYADTGRASAAPREAAARHAHPKLTMTASNIVRMARMLSAMPK
jgi:hypothetical protein